MPSIARGDLLVRVRGLGSLVLWISLRSLSDLLYRWDSHLDKQSAMGKLVFACLWVKFERLSLYTYIALFSTYMYFQPSHRNNEERQTDTQTHTHTYTHTHTHTHKMATILPQGSTHRGIKI